MSINMFLQVRTLVLLISVGSTLSAVLPIQDTENVYDETGRLSLRVPRMKRAANPTRAIMYSSYFSGPRGYNYRPPFQARNYEPQTAMSAFAAGNSVGTRSYYGNEYQPSNIQPNCGTCLPNGQDIPQGQPDSTGITLPVLDVATTPEPPVTIFSDPIPPQLPAEVPEEAPESVPNPPSDVPASPEIPDVPQVQETPVAPENGDAGKTAPNGNGNGKSNGNGHANGNGNTKSSKAPKAPPKKPAEDEDDEEYDEEEEQAFIPGKGRGPGKHYNSYFPIYFGLPGYGSRGQGEGGPLNPGVATAIANSYSNGRGAVATSHATAYGGPNFGNGSKKGPKGRTTPPQ